MTDIVYLEKRGRLTRAAHTLWNRWAEGSPRWVGLFTPLTDAVAKANLRRRLASRDTPADKPHVISVGALATGGSGKTPVVDALCAELLERGRQVALVTRGYGSSRVGPCRVAEGDLRCGDEARMLAARLPECIVLQSRNRKSGLAWLSDHAPDTEFVILEDGHQCAGAGRHLDILILDRWRLSGGDVVPEAGLRLPWGPYREGVAGATRADVWLVPLAHDEILPEQDRSGPVVLGFRHGRYPTVWCAESPGLRGSKPRVCLCAVRPRKSWPASMTIMRTRLTTRWT